MLSKKFPYPITGSRRQANPQHVLTANNGFLSVEQVSKSVKCAVKLMLKKSQWYGGGRGTHRALDRRQMRRQNYPAFAERLANMGISVIYFVEIYTLRSDAKGSGLRKCRTENSLLHSSPLLKRFDGSSCSQEHGE